MYQRFILSLCSLFIFCFATKAQQVKIGITSESQNGELKSTDPLNGKQHYTGYPFTLKKGMGAIFFIQSKDFSPIIGLSSITEQKYFGLPYFKIKDNKIIESRIAFTAPTDTSFYVLLTSVEENKTGAFTYGYYMLDSSQMNFNENFSTCDRLAYLFNQWQLKWELIKVNEKVDFKKNGLTVSSENNYTKNTLEKSKTGSFAKNHYEEIMFSDPKDEFGFKAMLFNDKICDEIKKCLDMNQWELQKEKEEQIIKEATWNELGNSITNDITHFIAKGAAKNQGLKSFKVIYTHATTLATKFLPEVKLVFNE